MKKISWGMVMVAVLALAVSLMPAVAGATTQARFAGTATGNWSNPNNPPVTGPPDNSCANMGAVGRVNSAYNFGFGIPSSGAEITAITVYVKTGTNGGQRVEVQLAEDASSASAPTYGVFDESRDLDTTDIGVGNCQATVWDSLNGTVANWGTGIPPLDPDIVNADEFGAVFRKVVKSSVKVDAICIEIEYNWTGGGTEPDPGLTSCEGEPGYNPLTVIKVVNGATPGSDWAYTGDLGAFSLPAIGGFQSFTPDDGTITITETTKTGYDASVDCVQDGTTFDSSETNSITINADLSEFPITCTFINTELGTLTVIKEVVGDAPAGDWPFSVTDLDPDFTLPAAGGSRQFNDVTQGIYTISETSKDGYIASVECYRYDLLIVSGETSVEVPMKERDNVVCRFVNEQEVVPPEPPPEAVPTIGQFGFGILALVLLGMGATYLRRRKS